MPLVTNVNHRSQAAYGSFTPRADLKRFGVAFAAIGDGGDGRFPHIDQMMNEGLPAGTSNQSLVYREFKDSQGKTHDITLPNGMKVREMIAPIEDLRAKEAIECAESQQLVDTYTTAAGIKDRPNEDGRVRLSSEVTENRLGTAHIPHEDLPTSPVSAAMPKSRKAVNGWTPERRAQASAAAKARLAKSQPQTQPT